MSKTVTLSRVAVLGASGYTGAELIRLLLMHPHVHIKVLAANTQADKKISEIYPHFRPFALPVMVGVDAIDWSEIDIAFGCLPHATSQQVIKDIPDHVKVIDLSADFRLADVATYEAWYGEHHAKELQGSAVYGLSEIARDAVHAARLVANPGCYPTASQLPLIPLLSQGLIEKDGIVIDAKSGVSGAGRSVKQNLLYTEVDEGINAYGIGQHRHTPEIEQGLSAAAGEAVQVAFTPHLVPMKRGILATIYAKLAAGKVLDDVDGALSEAYDSEPFVTVFPAGTQVSTHMVLGTNHCFISCHADRRAGHIIITSVIDNLCKGASGQAVQNMNIICGWPETTGLQLSAVFP